jgi:dTDP-4-dehydrorhamnose 3,5-epimerase-like enzyme
MEIPSFGSLRIIKLSEGQMSFTPLSIQGSWVFNPQKFDDERGSFHEVFKLSAISETLGFDFQVKQVNQSVSKAGVIRSGTLLLTSESAPQPLANGMPM